MSARRRVRAVVAGAVQGVGFRAYVLDVARRVGVSGWVRNRRDGTVELEAEGAPKAIERLLDAARRGPAFARVTQVDVDELDVTNDAEDFMVRHTAD